MFMYDDATLVEVLWEELNKAMRDKVELMSELTVAKRAVAHYQSICPPDEDNSGEIEEDILQDGEL